MSEVTASMTITAPVHIMGPKGEIIATIMPANDGNGFRLEFDREPICLTLNRNNGKRVTKGVKSLEVVLA